MSNVTTGKSTSRVDGRAVGPWLKEWIDQIGGFSAEVEEHTRTKRDNLIVFYKGALLFTAEFHRPTVTGGRPPRNISVIRGAHQKASEEGANFFVTSNFNETVLYDRRDSTRPMLMQEVVSFPLGETIKKDEDFRDAHFKQRIREVTKQVALKLLQLSSAAASYRPLDQSFLLGMEAQLEVAVEATAETIPPAILSKLWREEGRAPMPECRRAQQEKLARYALYILANKIMFYYVLKKSFAGLPVIDTSKAHRIEDLRELLGARFEEARQISGDYERVFEQTNVESVLFRTGTPLEPLKHVILFLNEYRIDGLNQDVVGNICDKLRLLSSEERHDFGRWATLSSASKLLAFNRAVHERGDQEGSPGRPSGIIPKADGHGEVGTRDSSPTSASILSALGDEFSRKILTSAVAVGRTVEEISTEQNICLSTCYDKIGQLVDDGMMVLERKVVTRTGKRFGVYRTSFSDATIKFRSGEIEVETKPNAAVLGTLHDAWLSSFGRSAKKDELSR